MLKEKQIVEALREVYDPEIPVNIYDLGFIYNIDIKEKNDVDITMTLTVPGCPMHQMITKMVEQRLKEIEGIGEVKVELTFDPPWSVEKISDEAKDKLRTMGYKV
ncbi:MAG: metal-sulfur cluster assembly factor [Candidatus Zixiibacteriota bacterium]